MKCIDPWLLNNRRQCPICKRYVFPNQENSDEEDNHAHAATEQTPLIQPSPDNSVINLSRNRQIGSYIHIMLLNLSVKVTNKCLLSLPNNLRNSKK